MREMGFTVNIKPGQKATADGPGMNAHHPLWNSAITSPTRSAYLVSLLEDHGWNLANEPDTPTYFNNKNTDKSKDRYNTSVIDLTLVVVRGEDLESDGRVV